MKQRKKLSSVLTAAVLCGVFMLSSCQIVEFAVAGSTYYDTEITTKDGKLITGRIGGQRSSNLPSGSKKISIKTDEGRLKVKSEDIKYLTLSRKSHPEKKQTLVYTTTRQSYTKKGVQKFYEFKCWHALNSVGDHIIITAYGHTFSLAKDGALVITYSSDEGIKYCLQREGDEYPIYFARSITSRSSLRKIWQEWLADDPVLCKKIANKEIDAFDFTKIAEEYNPKKK